MPESTTAHVICAPSAAKALCAASPLTVLIDRLISGLRSKSGQMRWMVRSILVDPGGPSRRTSSLMAVDTQRGEDVLHVVSLVFGHALLGAPGFRMLDDLADHLDDVRASAIGSLAVVQIQIDRDVKQPVRLFLELIQQRNRDDRAIQDLRQESNPFECRDGLIFLEGAIGC